MGAWSMAVELWQQYEYYYYNTHYNTLIYVCNNLKLLSMAASSKSKGNKTILDLSVTLKKKAKELKKLVTNPDDTDGSQSTSEGEDGLPLPSGKGQHSIYLFTSTI